MPTCVQTPRHAPPCSLRLQIQTPERPSVSMLPLALAQALARALAAPERSHHGRRRRAPEPSSLPLLQAFSVPTERVITISSSGRHSCAPFLATVVAGVPCRRWCCGHSRRRTWPGHHEPPRAKKSCPMDAREAPGTPPLPHRRRRASSGRKQRAPAPPLLQSMSGTSRKNLKKGRDLTA